MAITEEERRRAIISIRKYMSNYGKRHSRIHVETQQVMADKIRALDGICGFCPNVYLEVKRNSWNSEIVGVRCHKGHSPLSMYEHTELGQTPFCEDEKKEGVPTPV